VYNTPDGKRTLTGTHRVLFIESLLMVIHDLKYGDFHSGVQRFDELQRNQQIAVLLGIARALLRDNVPPPPKTAITEATVAAVYQRTVVILFDEIELKTNLDRTDPEVAKTLVPFSRKLALAAHQESPYSESEDLPEPTCTDREAWKILIADLRDELFWDYDWEMEEPLDGDPERNRAVKNELGIDGDYYVSVAPDPTDEQASQMLEDLWQLTAEVREHRHQPGQDE